MGLFNGLVGSVRRKNADRKRRGLDSSPSEEALVHQYWWDAHSGGIEPIYGLSMRRYLTAAAPWASILK